jgi:uncharacterized membrane protein YeaQ/YmgE (transglycosylase-associated protein family)
MSGETLLIILLVGLIAGWLAGQIVQGTGFGIIADIAIGVVGALIGSWLLPHLGIHLGSGVVPAIIGATIGAIVLLLILRLAYRRGRWWSNRGKVWLSPKLSALRVVIGLAMRWNNSVTVKTVSRVLKRTPGALRQKAYALGISLGHRNKRTW